MLTVPGTELALGSTRSWAWGARPPHRVKQGPGLGRQSGKGLSQSGRRGARGRQRELRALSLRAARRRKPRRENLTAPTPLSALARLPGLAAAMEDEEGADEQQQFSYQQVEESRVRPGQGEDGVSFSREKALGASARLRPGASLPGADGAPGPPPTPGACARSAAAGGAGRRFPR